MKKFLTSLIFLLTGLAIFILVATLFDGSVTEDYALIMGCGCASFASLLFFISFYLIGDADNVLLKLIRNLFTLFGLMVSLMATLPAFFLISGFVDPSIESPWLLSIGVAYSMAAFPIFILYYKSCQKGWRGGVYAYLSKIPALAGYVLGVIFAYVGGKDGFLYKYFPAIIAVVGFIVAGKTMIKNGFFFPIKCKERRDSKYYNAYEDDEDDVQEPIKEKEKKEKLSAADKLIDKKVGIKKLLFMLIVLTPISFIQFVLAYNIIFFIGAFNLSEVLLLLVILVIVNCIYTGVRFKLKIKDWWAFLPQELIISPLRFPLQLISDILCVISLFTNIYVCPRKIPYRSLSLFDKITVFALQYQKGGKTEARLQYDLGKRSSASSSSSVSAQNNAPSDTRKVDNSVFSSALKKEIYSRIVYNGDKYLYSYNDSWDTYEFESLKESVSWGKVQISGVLVLNFRRNSYDEHTVREIKSEAENVREKVGNKILSDIENVIEDIQSQYQGFDHSFDISVNLGLKFVQK